MAENKIDPKYYGTQSRLPVLSGCVVWLMIDRLKPSDVVTAVIWTIFGFLALALLLAPLGQNWFHPAELPLTKRGS